MFIRIVIRLEWSLQLYCLLTDPLTNKASCFKLDFSNPNTIGIQKDTQLCLQMGQPQAIMCAVEKYCLDQTTNTCQLINTKKGMCIDKNGFCVQNGSCFNCELNQCLSQSNKNTCQDLLQPSITYCKDSQGFCQYLDSGLCDICPDNYCLINKLCLNYKSLLKLVNNGQCFEQIKKLKTCVIQNLNVPNQNGNMNCMNNQSFCQDISINNNECLSCPMYFINPGDQKCYSLEQKLEHSPYPQQVYFEMQLIYIKQDCYDQNYCLVNQYLKCPLGCYSCNSPSFCTQCIEGYFLYQESKTKSICIKCFNEQPPNQDLSLSPYYKQIPTYQCLDCSSEYSLWQQSQSKYKTCQNFILQLDQNLQVVFSKYQAINYLVQSTLGLYSITQYQSVLCPEGCFSCVQESNSKSTCIKCQVQYVQNGDICEKCPDNCNYCQYAAILNGKAVFKSEIDNNKINEFQFIKICLECKPKYLVSYDLISCVQCGVNCDQCQYENKDEVLNYSIDQLTALSYSQFQTKNYIKKCLQCPKEYFVSFDGQSCVQQTLNCDYSSFKIVQGTQNYDLTEEIWLFVGSQQQNISISKICKSCSQGYILASDQSKCEYGCQSLSQQSLCNNCITTSSFKVQCQFCSNGQILNQIFNPPRCQDDLCKNNILGCAECYKYQDQSLKLNNQVYQCTKCQDEQSIPSIYGCIKCPEGCSKCYEGTSTFNFTSQLIYKRDYITIQDRLDYKNKNYKLICTGCLDGYYFDQQFKKCILIQCGQNCLKCIIINKKPQCIQCNYDKLINQISSLQYFVGMFYYKQNQINNPKQMITLTSSGDDCQICPLLCETCVNQSNVSQNPLYIYDAQCLSCKKTLDKSYILQNYSITYDKSRRKCYLCQKSEQGCYYKKQKIIYAQCLDLSSRLGDGSLKEPINFNRLNEVNLNQFIINELEFDQAVIFYNELQVKELEVLLIFVDNICQDLKPQNFTITLKEKFRTLSAILNITTLYSNFTVDFQQQGVFTVQGFDKIFIQNVIFQQQKSDNKFGISIQDDSLNTFQLINCQFHQISQFLEYQGARLIATNKFSQLQLKFLIISQDNLNYFTQYVRYNNSPNQNISIYLQNITFENSTFYHRSQILNSNILNYLSIISLKFYQSTFYQSQKELIPLIISNQFNVSKIYIIQNKVTNYNFMQQQDGRLNNTNQTSYFEQIQILDNIVTIDSYFLLDFQTDKNSNTTLNEIIIQRNQFYSEVTSIIIQLTKLNTVKVNNISLVDNQEFLFLKTENIFNVTIGQINLQQTDQQFLTPQICYLKQTIQQINIKDIIQQGIKVSKVLFNLENNIIQKQIAPLEIAIKNVISNQIMLVFKDNKEDMSIFSVISKQTSNLQIENVQFTGFQDYILNNKSILGKVSQGFYFDAPTVAVNLYNSSFNELDVKNQFGWINGQILSININYCNFTNQQSYLNIKTSRLGGFLNIIGQALHIYKSKFINGNAQIGGAVYWTSQNKGSFSSIQSQYLSNVAFSSDNLETQGGAIFVNGQLSQGFDVYIFESNFSNNFAFNQGGAIQIQPSFYFKTAITIKMSHFSNNFSVCRGSNISIQNQPNSKSYIILSSLAITSQIKYFIEVIEILQNNILKQYWLQINSVDSSLIYIQKAHDVEIISSTFQLSAGTSYDFQNSENLKFIFQKILIIQEAINFYDVQNIYQDSYFLSNMITTLGILNFYISDTLIQNNRNILDKMHNQRQDAQSAVFYNSQNSQIYKLNVANNICQYCIFGTIQIVGQKLQILNSTFQNNIAYNGPGLYLQQAQQYFANSINAQQVFLDNLIIINSKFINNKANLNGGAIYLKQSSMFIYETIFEQNKASQYGGAIFLENTQNNILINLINLSNCTFTQNQASFGGALGSTTGQRVNRFSNNTYQKNKASQYGDNIQTSPTKFSASINGKPLSDSNILQIKNHFGGYLEDDIILKLCSDQNQEILNIPKYSFLQIAILEGNGFLSQNKIYSQNGEFNLTQQIKVYGNFNQQLKLQVTSDLIQIPIFNSSQYIIGYSKYSLIIVIEMAKNCLIGQIPIKFEQKYDQCQDCKDTQYSFSIANQCQSCPDLSVKCYRDRIFLPSNLWRVNQQSIVLYPCKNCVGDIQISQAIQTRQLSPKHNDMNYYCRQGYVGALCEDCDRSGQYWGEAYYMKLDQKCSRCRDIKFTEVIYPLIISILAFIISIYLSQRLKDQINFKTMTKVVYLLFSKKFYGYETLNVFSVIKILIFQSSLIGIMFFYDHNIPNFVSQLFIDIGNLFSDRLRITECFLVQILQEISITFKGIYFLLVVNILNILCLVLYYIFFLKKYKCKKYLNDIILSTSIFVYYSISTIFSKIFRSLNCQVFDNQPFVTEYLSISCRELQNSNAYNLIALALVFTTLLIFYGYFVFKIYQRRFMIKTYQNQILFGFFTYEYKQVYYFWDLVRLIYKIFLLFIMQFSYLPTQLQIVMSILVSFTYTLLTQNFNPYVNEKQNVLDFRIQCLTTICFCLNSIQFRLDQNELQLTCTIALVCLVLLAMVITFSQILFNYKPKLIKIIQIIQQKSSKFKFVVKLFNLDKYVERSLKAQIQWEKLRKILTYMKFINFKQNFYYQDAENKLTYFYNHLRNQKTKTISEQTQI
ncbi:transmembrane protein, putative (macronuclear) [Tetrahymena thermophila SB210]|uniref:Transmembrane protein, putative n=1 Tax=Tetrahymena thermophila (strain SB210) TaxID=312017 RepID=W7XEK5_TETTS|nr:transmembrane protein, putative [Tetrahymena thermophila SB210]EWS71284.1 transmembrane protein, putative [Tetrahymena thermophila SB210]|eukprot:XP_012656190.1 transmembrane protein, putative [Tetrahymena thermophila SB210]